MRICCYKHTSKLTSFVAEHMPCDIHRRGLSVWTGGGKSFHDMRRRVVSFHDEDAKRLLRRTHTLRIYDHPVCSTSRSSKPRAHKQCSRSNAEAHECDSRKFSLSEKLRVHSITLVGRMDAVCRETPPLQLWVAPDTRTQTPTHVFWAVTRSEKKPIPSFSSSAIGSAGS